jgi:hypothetical protein
MLAKRRVLVYIRSFHDMLVDKGIIGRDGRGDQEAKATAVTRNERNARVTNLCRIAVVAWMGRADTRQSEVNPEKQLWKKIQGAQVHAKARSKYPQGPRPRLTQAGSKPG